MQAHPQSSGRIVQTFYRTCLLRVVRQLVAVCAAAVRGVLLG